MTRGWTLVAVTFVGLAFVVPGISSQASASSCLGSTPASNYAPVDAWPDTWGASVVVYEFVATKPTYDPYEGYDGILAWQGVCVVPPPSGSTASSENCFTALTQGSELPRAPDLVACLQSLAP